jgi:hypothetical protein
MMRLPSDYAAVAVMKHFEELKMYVWTKSMIFGW